MNGQTGFFFHSSITGHWPVPSDLKLCLVLFIIVYVCVCVCVCIIYASTLVMMVDCEIDAQHGHVRHNRSQESRSAIVTR